MKAVELVEVGPRDGLQNEKSLIPTEAKIRLIDSLSGAGFGLIEATSFVSPKWVPQLGDAAEVMAGITRHPDSDYIVLTPNQRGLAGALAAGVDEVAVFGAATEGFSQHNINCSVRESLDRFRPVVAEALAASIRVRLHQVLSRSHLVSPMMVSKGPSAESHSVSSHHQKSQRSRAVSACHL